ncbi:hypothetical protein [Sinorhizobium meliloti]|uniref:hypothetical protein n=1 Tax=Rhizobium meliloti TaxID=382 RepID=UPI000FD97ECC|nr:hypothetical protein [Sinorhizobium meliloti]RVG50547.1 hypothetical protein CN226_21550 [Sinorhizobium meliloti]
MSTNKTTDAPESNRLGIKGPPIRLQPGTINDLADRIIDVRARVDDLKEQRGVALLDSREFDSTELQQLETELDALVHAEGEAARRQRAAEEAAKERRREEVRKSIREIERKRLDAVRAAENAAVCLMVALRDTETYSASLDANFRLLGVISDKTTPESVKERFSRRLTATLKPLLVWGWRHYGSITFHEPRDCDAAQDWAQQESVLLEDHLSKALSPNQ